MGRNRKMPDDYGRYECSRCKEYKHPEEFYTHNYSANGIQAACKECMRDAARARSGIVHTRAGVILDAIAQAKLIMELKYYKAGMRPPEDLMSPPGADPSVVITSAIDRAFAHGYDVTKMGISDARAIADKIRKEAERFDPSAGPTDEEIELLLKMGKADNGD